MAGMSMNSRVEQKRPIGDRSSYRHMLDLVSARNFREIVNELLENTGAILADDDRRQPSGRSNKSEWTEAEIENYLTRHPLPCYGGLDRHWWIAFKGTRPTWDLICHLTFDGRPGLLLVEAKAHFGEMSEKNCKSRVDETKERSVANDLNIRCRLAETNLGMNALGVGNFHLSADHDYQLSNRLAYLHKLAREGVPTVLIYLGWIGSPDWVRDPFATEGDWEKAMQCHFKRIGPWEFVNQRWQFDSGGSLQMVVRSLSPSCLER